MATLSVTDMVAAALAGGDTSVANTNVQPISGSALSASSKSGRA